MTAVSHKKGTKERTIRTLRATEAYKLTRWLETNASNPSLEGRGAGHVAEVAAQELGFSISPQSIVTYAGVAGVFDFYRARQGRKNDGFLTRAEGEQIVCAMFDAFDLVLDALPRETQTALKNRLWTLVNTLNMRRDG